MSALVLKLKERLDRIDRETVEGGREKFSTLWLLEKHGMWRKGREVLREYPELEERMSQRGRGVGDIITFRELERQTGRKGETIAKWVKLFLAHPEEREFLAWAKKQAKSTDDGRIGDTPHKARPEIVRLKRNAREVFTADRDRRREMGSRRPCAGSGAGEIGAYEGD